MVKTQSNHRGYKRYKKYNYQIIEFDSPVYTGEFIKEHIDNDKYHDVRECKTSASFRGGKTISDMYEDMVYGDAVATASLLDVVSSVSSTADVDNGSIGIDIEGVVS